MPVVPALALLTALALALLPGPSAASARAAPARAAPAWGWPLPGSPAVQRPFAPGPTPYSAGHYGVDLAAAAGSPVLAAGAGTVVFAGLVAGRGSVVVDHGGLRTSYEPVEVAVAVGGAVQRGDLLGAVAPLGHACAGGGTCLHWGLRDGERYLDPLRLVRRPVRLLATGGEPLAGPPPGPAGGAPALARAAPGPSGTTRHGTAVRETAPDEDAPDEDAPAGGAAAEPAPDEGAPAGGAAAEAASDGREPPGRAAPRPDRSAGVALAGLSAGTALAGTALAGTALAGTALAGTVRRRGRGGP